MSNLPTDVASDGTISSRTELACLALIEERWRRAPGISLRLSVGPAGVVERPGRTRFDLQWKPQERRFCGPLRCPWSELPMVDGALQLVIIERLGAPDAQALQPLMSEALRLLADDGRLLIIDTNPWSWLGLSSRWKTGSVAPSAPRIAHWLLRLGLEDIESEHVLRLPPCPQRLLQRYGDRIDALCTQMRIVPGCIYAVSGRKRGSNVMAIPLRRGRPTALIAAPEGMRRAR